MQRTIRSVGLMLTGAAFMAVVYTCTGPRNHNGEMTEAGSSVAQEIGDAGRAAAKQAGQLMLPAPAFARSESEQNLLTNVAQQSTSSVVNISSERVLKKRKRQHPLFDDPLFRRFFERFGEPNVPRERRQRALGSGVIVSKDGYVITNHHVVAQADSVTVAFSDGRETEAEIVGTDEASDLAVLKLDEVDDDLEPLQFGNSKSLQLGDVVLAIGNPFGVGQTVTMGIVSAKGRANVGIVDYEDFIQTDAAINPGNSGGALVDMNGQLVGINTAIVTRSGGYQGIGFAIPSDMAQQIMSQLIDHGKVVRGWLGVVIQEVDSGLAEALGLPEAKGVLIADVVEDGPAAKAGIERGDLVLKVNGEAVNSVGALRNVVANAGAETKVKLRLMRDGEEKTVAVTLGERPEDPSKKPRVEGDGESALGGLRLGPLNDRVRERLDLPQSVDTGVVVLAVERGSEAARAGFRPGDVILEVNRKPMQTPKQVRSAYDEAGNVVPFLVQRGDRSLFIALSKDDG